MENLTKEQRGAVADVIIALAQQIEAGRNLPELLEGLYEHLLDCGISPRESLAFCSEVEQGARRLLSLLEGKERIPASAISQTVKHDLVKH